MANRVTTAQRRVQAALDARKVSDLRALRRALWRHGRLVLARVGQSNRTGRSYASAQAPCGRRVRFDLPFRAPSQGGRVGAFVPFEGEFTGQHPWYVYALLAGRGRIEAAFVGHTDELSRTFWEAGQPADGASERKAFEGWAAADGWPVRAVVLDAVVGEAGQDGAEATAAVLRLRWARMAALAGFELPGRERWGQEVGCARPIGPWPTEAAAAHARELVAVNAKGQRPTLSDFMLPDTYAKLGTSATKEAAPSRARPAAAPAKRTVAATAPDRNVGVARRAPSKATGTAAATRAAGSSQGAPSRPAGASRPPAGRNQPPAARARPPKKRAARKAPAKRSSVWSLLDGLTGR